MESEIILGEVHYFVIHKMHTVLSVYLIFCRASVHYVWHFVILLPNKQSK